MAPRNGLKWIRIILVWSSVLTFAWLIAFILTPTSRVTTHEAPNATLSFSLASNQTESLHSPRPSKRIFTVDAKPQAELCRSLKNRATWMQTSKDRSLPNPLLTADHYLEAAVFADVDSFLATLPDEERYVILVIADSVYREVALNWMCVLYKTSAPLSLSHVLVLSMDKELHMYLRSKGISSVFTQYNQLLNMSILKCRDMSSSPVWMTRILMIHYILKKGFDAFVMDTDAFPVRDPMNMINEIVQAEGVDAIFGRGTHPSSANSAWGFTLCFGTAYFRNTPGSLHLLEAMGRMNPLITDDQVRLNMAIKTVTGVNWRTRPTYGVTVGSSRSLSLQFKVAVMPYSVVCRSTCRKLLTTSTSDERQDLHIVHASIARWNRKKGGLQQLGYWVLDEGKLEKESHTAETWLADVCTRKYTGLRV